MKNFIAAAATVLLVAADYAGEVKDIMIPELKAGGGGSAETRLHQRQATPRGHQGMGGRG
jgi:hypothetical protein